MTREELRVRIREEIERRGTAVVAVGDLWSAFNSPGEDASILFDDALLGFAALNRWEIDRSTRAEADTNTFRPSHA